MKEPRPAPNRREQRKKKYAEVRARNREKRSTVTGLKAAVSAQGEYVYVNSWGAYGTTGTYDDLVVYANVSGSGSTITIESLAIDVLPASGANPYATAEADLNDGVTEATISTATELVSPLPASVVSLLSGTVNTPNGVETFYFYQTLGVYTRSSP